MPTGYTAAIKDGISFEQFVWSCARAFGALVTMRDDAMDAPIPESFKPSTYYAEQVAEANDRIATLKALTPEQASTAATAAQKAAEQRIAERKSEAQALRSRYDAMLAQVIDWEAPTPEHAGLKDFMVSQLRQSIDFDCGITHLDTPKLLDGATWLARELAEAYRALAYYTRSHADELERTAQRNAWLKALRDSVPPPAA